MSIYQSYRIAKVTFSFFVKGILIKFAPNQFSMKKVGLIGGSGLEKVSLFDNLQDLHVQTPYGAPSSLILKASFPDGELYIISRHGRDHTITPTHVNNRANISALKQLGCNHVLATTACGSLREEIGRGDIVIPDQFIDFTQHRANSFHDDFVETGPVHASMPDPFDQGLREILISTAKGKNIRCHPKGTIVTIEGPRFSTRAESQMFRLLGADIINMSIAPEAALANEAKLNYAAIALSTDYDCWKTDEDPVTWDEIFRVFEENVKHVTNLLADVILKID
jgi:5'-methylthioadenosine phosphorylase